MKGQIQFSIFRLLCQEKMSARSYWIITVLYVAGIYSVLGVMPGVWRWIDGVCGGNGIFLIYALFLIPVAFLLAYLVFVKKEKSFLKYCIFLGLFVCLFLLGILEENPGEKIHMPIYLLAGILIFVSMKKSGYRSGLLLWLIGGAICLAAGLFDEVIQLFLSNRSFRWHDVFVNCGSALIGFAAMKMLIPGRISGKTQSRAYMKNLAAGVFIFILTAAPANAAMHMVALDVGKGQAILFEKNGHGLMVDAGPVHKAGRVVKDLKKYGVDRLDYLILTHLHPDHASGMFRLMEQWPGVRIVKNGHRISYDKVSDMVRWSMQALDSRENVRVVGAGDQISWQGAHIRFLWPEKAGGQNMNQDSLVMYLSYRGDRVLIMGDAGISVEKELMEKKVFSGSEDVDVLAAGHHGSKNTSSRAFLQLISPDHVIVSVDKNNIDGYPHSETVKRLKKFSKKLYITWDGDVVLKVGN